MTVKELNLSKIKKSLFVNTFTYYGGGTGWKAASLFEKALKVSDIGVDAASLFYKTFGHKYETPSYLAEGSIGYSFLSIRNDYLSNKIGFQTFSDVDDLVHYINNFFN